MSVTHQIFCIMIPHKSHTCPVLPLYEKSVNSTRSGKVHYFYEHKYRYKGYINTPKPPVPPINGGSSVCSSERNSLSYIYHWTIIFDILDNRNFSTSKFKYNPYGP